VVIATDRTSLRFMHRQRVVSLRTDRDQKILTVRQAWSLLKFLTLETLSDESPTRNPGISGLLCLQVDRSRN
jgi:hypothetical protein